MSNQQAGPGTETRGVTVELLATVDLANEIEGMAGRELRMRMVTIQPGGSSARFTTTPADQGPCTSYRKRSLTTATVSLPSTAPEWAGLTIGTRCIWLENRGTIPAVEISVDIVSQE